MYILIMWSFKTGDYYNLCKAKATENYKNSNFICITEHES